ncbi:MAG: hotdog fold thioesterase [Pseudomonadota bacterium]|nr:hotdog fold thioesterase [Pseudomonadota bacterium]
MSKHDALAEKVVAHLYSVSPVLKHWGIEVAGAKRAAVTLTMTVRKDMSNTNGVCHGGVIFSLADACFGFSAGSYNDRGVGASCDIRFLKPAEIGDRLTATASEVWRKGRSGLYDVTIVNQGGDKVALMRGHARQIGGHYIEETD